ncbi:peptide MFS transporter [Sphingobacterium bovistauri]|uniref:Peptide MFS transporter n=1 Tax=Sphingobacterium bovistauri TaxID=2781959 RepID=A0ABS7Z4T5_9SPHI|nr:peptide MFS transporter [Sphingobacterium bovistauri]MCA5003764.1 peptide MFS transporter [Sphingobacterium bovistauri]
MIQQQDELLEPHLDKLGASNKQVFGHPAALFVLFFTEMWERFSYYGMRALLTVFLISEITKGGWGWSNAEAMSLYGWYTSLVYATPLIGGMIADKLTGFKKAILIGALLMTLGHASMALEGFDANFFYIGLGLMILGNGMFKPNISSMVGQLYPDKSSKKDAGYTIFYMGINAGAFLGSLLCGYLGEKIGWHYGFGLAGVFMFFGMLQFYFGQKIFGVIGDKPKTKEELAAKKQTLDEEEVVPKNVVRDRLFVVAVLMIASIFFFLAFEQAGGSLSIFAKDFTQRVLEGSTATTFKWVDAILTIFPIVVVTYVLLSLAKKLFKEYPLTIIFTLISFASIAVLGLWKVQREFTSLETEVTVSWFQILNAFFIVMFASAFSKLWEKVWNPSGPIKFALGLFLVGFSFVVVAYGAMDIPAGAAAGAVRVSMIWLVLAYFFQTMGELCLSPVGLSYVSKLSPKKLLGLIFGFWFLASAISNKIAGVMGGMIDSISEKYSLSTFFMIIAIMPMVVALILVLMNPMLKKKMHGIN